MNARVHIYAATALERGRVASPTLGRLYPQGKPPVLIFSRLSEPPDQSGHEGAKKSPPLRHPCRQARGQAPCRLSYLAHHSLHNLNFGGKCILRYNVKKGLIPLT